MQEDEQGVEQLEHPLCYFSKKFSVSQKKKSVIEKELLIQVLALQYFAVYLPAIGPTIKVNTDHHP